MNYQDKGAADHVLSYAAEIVVAHVFNNKVDTCELPLLIAQVYSALKSLGKPVVSAPLSPVPAVPIGESVWPGYIVCLEDGKKLKNA